MKKVIAPSFQLSELDKFKEELLAEFLYKYPKYILIINITARKNIQRSGKEDSTKQGWRKIENERKREKNNERKTEKDK